MSDNKILCTADEYAYLETSRAQYAAKLERLKALKSGTAFADSAPKIEYILKMFDKAMATFQVRPGSERTGSTTLSAEFQENFKTLKESFPEFTAVVLDT